MVTKSTLRECWVGWMDQTQDFHPWDQCRFENKRQKWSILSNLCIIYSRNLHLLTYILTYAYRYTWCPSCTSSISINLCTELDNKNNLTQTIVFLKPNQVVFWVNTTELRLFHNIRYPPVGIFLSLTNNLFSHLHVGIFWSCIYNKPCIQGFIFKWLLA